MVNNSSLTASGDRARLDFIKVISRTYISKRADSLHSDGVKVRGLRLQFWYAQRGTCLEQYVEEHVYILDCPWQLKQSIQDWRQHVHTLNVFGFFFAFLLRQIYTEQTFRYLWACGLIIRLWIAFYISFFNLTDILNPLFAECLCAVVCRGGSGGGRLDKQTGVKKLWTAWRHQQRGGGEMRTKLNSILSNISHLLCGGLRATDNSCLCCGFTRWKSRVLWMLFSCVIAAEWLFLSKSTCAAFTCINHGTMLKYNNYCNWNHCF